MKRNLKQGALLLIPTLDSTTPKQPSHTSNMSYYTSNHVYDDCRGFLGNSDCSWRDWYWDDDWDPPYLISWEGDEDVEEPYDETPISVLNKQGWDGMRRTMQGRVLHVQAQLLDITHSSPHLLCFNHGSSILR